MPGTEEIVDPAPPSGSRAGAIGLAATLAVAVVIVYWPVSGFDFVNYDDPAYLSANPVVRAGLTWRGLIWAFSDVSTGNWHPLTWLSLMFDVTAFGVDPGVHHVVNVALHAISAVLLLWVLAAATGSTWRSALVAALFALHPLHVESVAWISERKDLLAALFGILALGAWVAYSRRPARLAMCGVACAQILSLACKPMLVSLPVVLLALDRWPQRRPERLVARVREKAPLFAISACSSAIALAAQRGGGAISPLESVAVPARLENAVVSYAVYLWKAVWPTRLAVVYPHPAFTGAGLSAALVFAAAVPLVALTALAIRQRHARPWLATGWLWYVVMLVPVIGLVQVGPQALADRYTYLPLVGIFVAVAWSIPARVGRPAAAVAVAALAALAVATRVQLSFWKDSLSLFERALAVTRDNATAHRNLGVAWMERGRLDPAILELRESLRLSPGDAWAWMDLGIGLAAVGDAPGAGEALRRAVLLRPEDDTIRFNMGVYLASRGDTAGALGVLARLQARGSVLVPELERLIGRTGRVPLP